MRVISGIKKGFKLKAPKGNNTRPTSDKVKESLFNILENIDNINNSLVLDLFSGTGNIGIEFLSRGAKECYFIENNIESIKVIRENLNKTNFINQSKIYKNDVIKAIKILGKKELRFDYIFLDPPYSKGLSELTLDEIEKNNILNENGIIIIEHESKSSLKSEFLQFYKYDTRKYGDTSITIYRHK